MTGAWSWWIVGLIVFNLGLTFFLFLWAPRAKVPVLQAPPLARALYATTELDHEIPMPLYSAVAQVLAHVYRLREAMAGRAPYPGSLEDIAVPPELDPADPRHSPRAARRGAATP